MIQVYLGNNTYEYTLLSGKVIVLTDDELKELTGSFNNTSEMDMLKFELRKFKDERDAFERDLILLRGRLL